MKQLIKSGIITALICVSLLFITALIPRSAIQKNMEKSAEYYDEHILFDHVNNHVFVSRQDNYADCILTNIIYNINDKDLLKSVVSAKYYENEDGITNESFSYAVKNDVEPNVDYSRYWHGSMVILRPLFVLFDISGVRMTLGIIILIFTILFEILMIKNKYYVFAVSYLIGLFATAMWMTAFCVEYATTILVLAVELPIVFLMLEKKDANLYKILLCAGVVTAFVDFLTTETLTFTMPFLLYVIYKEKNGLLKSFKEEISIFIKAGLSWVSGYALMQLAKWMLAMAVLGPGAFVDALKQAGLRMNGLSTMGNVQGAQKVSFYEQITGAIWRNVGNLLPFKDTMKQSSVMAFITLIIVLTISIWYLFRTKNDNCMFIMLLILMAIPFVRFVALNNHSYIHFFFTYRALLVSVTAWIYAMAWLILSYTTKNRRKRRR